MISGSRIHRVVLCPASESLPHVTDAGPRPEAERGTLIHRFLERAIQVGADVAMTEAPEHLRPYLAAIDFESLPAGLAAEVSFAWDWKARTGRELGRNLGRNYQGLAPREIPLTMDLVGLDKPKGLVLVRDYKTGHTRLPRPGSYGQTLLGGLAACSAYGVDTAVLELTYLDGDGDTWTVRDTVDAWDLATYGDAIERAMEEVQERTLDGGDDEMSVVEGDHCAYCPAFKSCPAKTALVRQMPGLVDAASAPGYLAPDRLAKTFHQIQAMKEILGRVESEVFALAAFDELDLGDGTVLGPVTTVREKYQGDVAAQVLTDIYGPEVAKRASKISVTKESLRDAVHSQLQPGDKLATKAGTGKLDRVNQEIRARNGVDMTRTTSVRVHRPKARRITGGEP